MTTGLDEVYQRLHRFGPEYGGDEEGNNGLTNHGPMAAEVMSRRGIDINIDRWVDRYERRLTELPRPSNPIGPDWLAALGDSRRLPDWTAHFSRELHERPWADVVGQWWPRLLPGIVAGSTHGVIRVGHAVRALNRSGPPTTPNLNELAHGLAFWAARYRPIAGVTEPSGTLDPGPALATVARLADRSGLIVDRLNRLEREAGWPASLRALRPAAAPDDVIERLDDLIAAAVSSYARYGHSAPVLLVHTATAPNAVRHVLPILPHALWRPSLTAAWTASAAVMAAYAPPQPIAAPAPDALDPADALERAAAHGDEHVLKFTDTAIEAYDRTGNPELLAATVHAGELIQPAG